MGERFLHFQLNRNIVDAEIRFFLAALKRV
jgi:hypothetical protein